MLPYLPGAGAALDLCSKSSEDPEGTVPFTSLCVPCFLPIKMSNFIGERHGSAMLENWPRIHEQHDVAELLTHLNAGNPIECMQGTWESRLQVDQRVEVRDRGSAVPLLHLPVPTGGACSHLWRTGPTYISMEPMLHLSRPRMFSVCSFSDFGYLQRGAVHPTLHVHDDNRIGATASVAELNEICCN